MKVIMLAAGYVTRLYPLTLTQRKTLLPVADKPMVEYVLDNLAPTGGMGRVFVVTNANSLPRPWISTSSLLDVAQAYDSGNGVVAIDLNDVPSFQAQVWQYAPRVNGVQGLPFQRSFWAQEITIFQTIPASAIKGFVK